MIDIPGITDTTKLPDPGIYYVPPYLDFSAPVAERKLRVWTCTDHEGVWNCGISVVVATTEDEARSVLRGALFGRGFDGDRRFSLQEIDLSEPGAYVLSDGDE